MLDIEGLKRALNNFCEAKPVEYINSEGNTGHEWRMMLNHRRDTLMEYYSRQDNKDNYIKDLVNIVNQSLFLLEKYEDLNDFYENYGYLVEQL